jgi:glycosyltransferase involved in cell wall biosynthesis
MRIIWFGEGVVTDTIRMIIPGYELKQMGYQCDHYTIPKVAFDSSHLLDHQHVAVFCRPHTSQLISKFKRQGSKIICDMDDDFWSIPKGHPGYDGVGRGNPESLKLMDDSLEQADLLTVASKELMRRLTARFPGKPIVYIPNGWTRHNPLWTQRSQAHEKTHLGWSGSITHRADFLLVKKALEQVTFSRRDVSIVIGGDPEIYRMLHRIPEDRKIFVPELPYTIYPQTLGYFDIGLAPLVKDQFNRAKSDIKLMEYGVKGIPWLSSTIEPYIDWGIGGYYCSNYDDWIEAINLLLDKEDRRKELGELGHQKAMTREGKNIAQMWKTVLDNL